MVRTLAQRCRAPPRKPSKAICGGWGRASRRSGDGRKSIVTHDEHAKAAVLAWTAHACPGRTAARAPGACSTVSALRLAVWPCEGSSPWIRRSRDRVMRNACSSERQRRAARCGANGENRGRTDVSARTRPGEGPCIHCSPPPCRRGRLLDSITAGGVEVGRNVSALNTRSRESVGHVKQRPIHSFERSDWKHGRR